MSSMLVSHQADLSNEESGRRLVPEGVWERLKQYFPSACEFGAEWSYLQHVQGKLQLIFSVNRKACSLIWHFWTVKLLKVNDVKTNQVNSCKCF